MAAVHGKILSAKISFAEDVGPQRLTVIDNNFGAIVNFLTVVTKIRCALGRF
jgi:hypothetical protein